MIPASKKRSFTEVPENLTAQLEQTLNAFPKTEKPEKSETVYQAPSAAPVTPVIKTVTKPADEKPAKKNDRNGQINICVPPETKTDWKILFAKNNVNITQGIIFAVEHLKNEIEKGEAVLTVGGVIAKTKSE